jgi:hypothetical protein
MWSEAAASRLPRNATCPRAILGTRSTTPLNAADSRIEASASRR